jgi:hypothetical protein
MPGAGGKTAYAVAKARFLIELSRQHIRVSATAIRQSHELLAIMKVYPFSTCLEPCCALNPDERDNAEPE